MWSIAVKTLFADRGKLLTALVGVCFSVILVNIQGGLFLGMIRKASMLVDHGQADIWVGHRKMYNIDFPRDIPRRWLYRIEGLPGIARAEPYIVGFSEMTLPTGGFEGVVVVGVEEASLLGNTWNLQQGQPDDVLKTDGIIVDELEGEKLVYPELGELREIGGVRARVVAKSRGVMGFLVNPYVFTTYNRAAQFLKKPPNVCSYFLVQIEPGEDPQAICQAIRERIPDVEAYTREEYSTISVNYWMTRTGLGISFGAATLLGVLVGLVMVAETLYALVLDRLTEFGTLKAIGAAGVSGLFDLDFPRRDYGHRGQRHRDVDRQFDPGVFLHAASADSHPALVVAGQLRAGAVYLPDLGGFAVFADPQSRSIARFAGTAMIAGTAMTSGRKEVIR